MSKRSVSLLLALATLLPVMDAHADASASVVLNGRTIVSQIGTGWNSLDHAVYTPVTVTLSPGETRVLSFDYTLSVRDDGLAASPPDPSVFGLGCVGNPRAPLTCAPSYTGHEAAKAIFGVVTDSRLFGYGMYYGALADRQSDALQTQGDSFAESLSQSGTINVTALYLGDPSPRGPVTVTFGIYAGAWAYAAAVPEASTVQLLVFGLASIALAAAKKRSRFVSRETSTSSI